MYFYKSSVRPGGAASINPIRVDYSSLYASANYYERKFRNRDYRSNPLFIART